MESNAITGILIELLKVFHINIFIIFMSAILGLVLSVFVTLARVKRIPIISQVTELYVSFNRSVPGILLLFIVFFGLPFIMSKIGMPVNDVGPIVAAILSMGFYHSAYLSEVFRPAYLAVEKGQHEAALSFGYTPSQKFFRIIFPQFIPIALPGYGNALVYLIHDTSLVFTIGVVDIMGSADLMISRSYGINQIAIYIIAALLFCLITFITDIIIRYFERKTQKYHLDMGITKRVS